MHPELIKARMRMNNVTVTSLAAELGCSGSYIHQVIAGKRYNPDVVAAVAKVADLPISEVWSKSTITDKQSIDPDFV